MAVQSYLLNKSGQIGEFKNVIPCFSIRCGLVSMKLPGLIEKLRSVIVGPAMPSSRPYIDIQEVKIDLSVPALDLTYRTGGTAHIDLFVDRMQTIATVDVNYPVSTDVPFATIRSMHVSEGHADVAHIRNVSGSFPILSKGTPLKGRGGFSIARCQAATIRLPLIFE